MPSRSEPNDSKSPNMNHRSFLVTLSARAIGSLGFGLSILAIGIRWLVPLAVAVTPGVVDKPRRANRRSRRRLTRGAPARPPVPQATPPITVNGQSTTSNSYRDKHVYFANTPAFQRSPTSTGKSLMTLHDSVEESSPEETPPLRTPSMTPPSVTDVVIVKKDDESVVESDSSSRRSSLSLPLSKKILHFGNKSRQDTELPRAITRSSLNGEGKHNRRSSIGIVPPWSSRRKSLDTPAEPNDSSSRPPTPLKSASFASALSDTIQPSMASYFSSKTNSRRTSTPNTRRRTQPYDAPYFALPPTSATFDLRKSPPMLQEALINSTMQHVSEDNRGRSSRSRQSLTRRRSASEGWNNGRRATKIF